VLVKGGGPDDVLIPDEARGGGLALVGGGRSASPPALDWMIDHMGRPGNLVVLEADGDPHFSADFALGQIHSITELYIGSRDCAFDPTMSAILATADAIYIGGGKQERYVEYWENTPVSRAIEDAARRGVPVGGTSAGLAVLGEYAYSDLSGASAQSPVVLLDPYNVSVTIDQLVRLPYLENVITDSHFIKRDRMGRLVTFVARVKQDFLPPGIVVHGVGIDEDGALLVETRGPTAGVGMAMNLVANARSVVYILDSPDGPPQECAQGVPLNFGPVQVRPLLEGETIDFNNWVSEGTPKPYSLWARDGGLIRDGGSCEGETCY
jgi:cyanophycinase